MDGSRATMNSRPNRRPTRKQAISSPNTRPPPPDASAAPSHYGWKQPARFEQIERAYQAAKSDAGLARPSSAAEVEASVRRILRELDEAGRWVVTYAGEPLVGQPKFSRGFRF